MSYLEQLATVRDQRRLTGLVESHLQDNGFDSCIFSTSSQVWLCNFPADTMESYIQHKYYRIDPIKAAAERSRLPIAWDAEDSRNRCSGDAARMFQETLDAGYKRGITVPLWGPHGVLDLLVGLTSMGRRDFDRVQRRMGHDLMVMAAHMSTIMHEPLFDEDTETPLLTKRERQCLYWTAQGKTAWEVAKILEVSTSTVNFHIQNASRKFGVHSKGQAAIRAAQRGLIDL